MRVVILLIAAHLQFSVAFLVFRGSSRYLQSSVLTRNWGWKYAASIVNKITNGDWYQLPLARSALRKEAQDQHHTGVRTLLIDNYDSYTYNLFQQLAVINGQAPFVVYNDQYDGDFWYVT
ncbi:unnamed protein product [Choristocarpus tenellus]